MSDLCYNCSTCHLQAGSCLRDLVQCEICFSWGHQYIFCPRGVAHRDPTYRYWALCHNCDMWHLPNACLKPYHLCEQCGNTGHMEFFCPVRSIGRLPYLQAQQQKIREAVPEPTNHDTRPPFSGDIAPEYIARMKLAGVHQAFSLLDDGYGPAQVIAFMSGPPRAIDPVPLLRGFVDAPVQQPHVRPAQLVQQFPKAQNMGTVEPNVHHMKQEQVDANKKRRRATPDAYMEMHHRFDQGTLAKSIEQERPMDTMPMPGTALLSRGMPRSHAPIPTAQTMTPKIQNTTLQTFDTVHETPAAGAELQSKDLAQEATPVIETAEKPGKVEKTENPRKIVKIEHDSTPGGSAIKQGPRCAKCVKSHKRCTHRTQMSPTPQSAFETSFQTPGSSINYLATSGAPDGYVPTTLTKSDRPFVSPIEQVDTSTQIASTEAAITNCLATSGAPEEYVPAPFNMTD